ARRLREPRGAHPFGPRAHAVPAAPHDAAAHRSHRRMARPPGGRGRERSERRETGRRGGARRAGWHRDGPRALRAVHASPRRASRRVASPTRRRERPMPAEVPPPPRRTPTLIYDGECGFCRESVGLVRRWDRERRLAIVPFQDQERVAAFGIPLTALAAAMHLVLPDGRVFAGADAAPELLRLLPGKRWLA